MLGNILSGVGNLVSGFLGRDAAKDANKANLKAAKEFAQHGIRWKVEDAKAAGIHPLYAIGAPTASYSGSFSVPDFSDIARAGQDIGRAIDATRTRGERVDAYTKTVQDLTLQRMGLENQLLSAQIAKVRQSQAPAMDTPGQRYLVEGQGPTALGGLVATVPLSRQAFDPSALYREAGAVTDVGFTRSEKGYAPVMSKDAKERLEDDFLGMLGWNLRNRLVSAPEPPVEAPEGYDWVWNPITMQYEAKRTHSIVYRMPR